jgi:hypothetical protein
MKIALGASDPTNSWQGPFPTTVPCTDCPGECRMAFTMRENTGDLICDLYQNHPGMMWPHDACAFAVYFCKECLAPAIRYNQA